MFSPMPQITPQEAKTKAGNGNFIIIDVREDRELKVTNLSLVSVPFTHIKMNEIVRRISELPKDKQLGILCHSGNRSSQVTRYLRQQGFDAVNIQGGIENWAKSLDPVLPRY